jgi:hypothetical protein
LNDSRIEKAAGIAAHRQQGAEVRRRERGNWEHWSVKVTGEQIEELGAELQGRVFSNPKVLERREIDGALSGRKQNVATRSSQGAQGWRYEGLGIEEFRSRLRKA